MLILLTGIYCGVIWLVFFKLELLPWNKLSRNLSILGGIVGLIAVVLGLVQGSPSSSGGIQFVARVTTMAAHSPGLVVEAAGESYQAMKKGDLILAVDDTTYAARVKQLEAELKAAESGVEQMQSALDGAKAAVKSAEAQLEVWTSSMAAATASREGTDAILEASRSKLKAVDADVKRNEFNVKTADAQVGRIRELVKKEIESVASLDSAENALTAAKAALIAAQSALVQQQEDILSREANARAARANEQQVRDQKVVLEAQLAQAQANERKAQQQLDSTIDGEHSTVLAVKAQLASARYDLAQTRIVAPADGFIVGFSMTVGDWAGKMPFCTFVATDTLHAIATFDQTVVGNIKPGQEAEIALRSRPGQILPATVEEVVWAAGESQVMGGGNVPMVDQIATPTRVAVRFRLTEPLDPQPAFGASGEVAVYTDRAQPISIIRKIILRMSSLLYYFG